MPLAAEFAYTHKYSTNSMTVEKDSSSRVMPIEFKEYSPTIFARLRRQLNLADKDFVTSVAGGDGYNDFISNSKSGSFFYYSHDNQYMIKSQKQDEIKYLRRILPSYFGHLIQYKDSLINRILGVYRMRKGNQPKLYFFIMRNVFFSSKPIHVRFDLKGSSVGRQAKEREKEQAIPVLKDYEFQNGFTIAGRTYESIAIKLGNKKPHFVNQMKLDAALLYRLNIMDYSLLVGIHYRDRGDEDSRGNNTQRNYGTRKHDKIIPREMLDDMRKNISSTLQFKNEPKSSVSAPASSTDDHLNHSAITTSSSTPTVSSTSTSTSTSVNTTTTLVTATTADSPHLHLPSAATSSSSSSKSLHLASQYSPFQLMRQRSSSLFTEDDGGMASGDDDDDDDDRNEVYYVGMIDILQEYNARKKAEHFSKSFYQDGGGISCVSPHDYATRFIRAIVPRIQGHDPDDATIDAFDIKKFAIANLPPLTTLNK